MLPDNLWFEVVIYRKGLSSSKTCLEWRTTFGVSLKQVVSSSLPGPLTHNYNLPSFSLRENGCPTGYPVVSFISRLFMSRSIHKVLWNSAILLPKCFNNVVQRIRKISYWDYWQKRKATHMEEIRTTLFPCQILHNGLECNSAPLIKNKA